MADNGLSNLSALKRLAVKIGEYESTDMVPANNVTEAIDILTQILEGPVAPIEDPEFEGTPTAPDITSESPDDAIANKKYVDDSIEMLGTVVDIKGTKATVADLEAITDAEPGDLWFVAETNSEYIYTSAEEWEEFGPTIDLSGYSLSTNLAAEYSASATYAVGDLCTKDSVLYRCNMAIASPEAWTAAHWTATDVVTEAQTKNVKDYGLGNVNGAVVMNAVDDNIANGAYSTAEGYHTLSSGVYSHAEGHGDTANSVTGAQNDGAHSEGYMTKATGIGSHAEGKYTIASGEGSHAEGYGSGVNTNATTATGQGAHAEGYGTKANGKNSHTEGQSTTAYGDSSHAEGLVTKAYGVAQHVFGSYNVPESSQASNTKGTFVEIVGNGTSANDLSNARTLDWNGNEVLAGKLTVGAGPTGDMDAATKKYADDLFGEGAANLADTYSSSASYSIGDYCVHDGILYKCNTAIASPGEAWNSSHWTEVTLSDELSTVAEASANNLSDEYSSTSSYDVGDYCVYEGDLYICNTAIASPGEAWNAAHWTHTTVAAELPKEIELNGTLTAGQTQLIFSNAAITVNSMVEIYTDQYGVAPTEVTTAAGSITMIFDALESNLAVKVVLK